MLGLPESPHTPNEFETSNVTIGLWHPESDGEEFQPNTAGVALRVPDVHAAIQELGAKGAEIIGVQDSGVCHMGFVKDTEGNVLILHKRYTPHG